MAEVATAMPVPVDVKCKAASTAGKHSQDALPTQIAGTNHININKKQTMAPNTTDEIVAPPKRKKRKPSAIRDFPPGCGRFATPLNPIPIPPPPSPAPEQQQKGEILTSPPPPPPVVVPPAEGPQEQMSVVKDPQINILMSIEPPSAPQDQQKPIVVEEVDTAHAPPTRPAADMAISPTPPADIAISPIPPAADMTLSSNRPDFDMTISSLLTQPTSPSMTPVRYRTRSVSANRDFPFGCGRNAPPATREECLRAGAPLKAPKNHQHIKPHEANAESPAPEPPTCIAKNQQHLVLEGNEPTPFFPGNALKEEKYPPDEQEQALVDDLQSQPKPESPQNSELNDTVANGGTKSKRKASPLSEGPDKENTLPDWEALMESTDCSQTEPKPESSQTSQVKGMMGNGRNKASTPKKKAYSPQKPKLENSNAVPSPSDSLNSQANKADNQLDLVPMDVTGVPMDEEFGMKLEEEKGKRKPADEQVLVVSPPRLRSQSKPKGSRTSKEIENTANGGTSVNGSKSKGSPAQKPKVQSINFALIPLDSTNAQARSDDGTVTRAKVRETMRLFQVLYRKFLQEEENHAKEAGQGKKRPDVMASKILKENNKYVNTGKQIVGNVPGVEVGDEFHYRIELCIVGLHRQSQGGIDYLKQGNTLIATSIVAQGGYADDLDTGEVLIYTGQGGCGSDKKGQVEDQKLERGNLSLKTCIDLKSPVRVIRGIKDSKNSSKDIAKNKSGITYTYDGLYLVEKYWQERGATGFSVFKFQLRRMAGQPELAWNIVKSVGRSKKGAPREGLRLQDVSQGKETRPICVVNMVDDEAGPPPFEYTSKIINPPWYHPAPPRGCDCVDGCDDSDKCFCAVKNGGELPYNYNGAIVEAKSLVYECGPSCKCPPTCHNRVSQHGIRINLEIFKTDKRGWGVRSLSSIPSGSFICEYTGELLSEMEAEQRTGNDEYLFDIGRTDNQSHLWDGLSGLVNKPLSLSLSETTEDSGYTIDAAKHGGVGRFINHSCSPNLYAQNVLYDHDDTNVPHIMLFAAENIPPLQELCYHYNYSLDQVRDSEGNIKKKNCYCGSAECTGRLY